MDPNNPITSTQFCAFVKCRTKAYLLTQGEPAPESHFAAAEARISSMYKHIAKQQLFIGTARIELREFEQLLSGQKFNTTIYHIDCETAVYDVSPPSGAINPRLSGTAIPVLFVPWEKPGSSHNLLVCFGALAVSQVTGTVPHSGTLIFGDGFRRKTVKIASHVARTRQIIHAIKAASRDQKSPALILNRHCPICDFQSRCRGIATARDDLSLLTGMTEKERARCAAKGISTISQLSYGYRPRRRKRNTAASRLAPTAKNDHKLKALAIKKSQIHVVGTPSLKFEGVPIFLDVEGMPDRDFYYLIGLRFEHRGEIEERSFWADRLDGERGIWEDCLRTLKAIENALIISYGAYEIRFLKQMTERYVHEPNDVVFVDRLIKTSVNILSCIYGKVYFPTHSNSLKEVARYLGFEWRQPRLSGAVAPLVRRESELSANNALKFELIGYNMDDCRAATLVADAIVRICSAGGSDLDKVDVSSLEVGFQHTFGKLDCALPEFKKINDAAYWDYQRSKVYARTDKAVRRSVQKTRGRRKRAAVDKRLTVEDFPDRCPKCSGTRFWSHHSYSQVVFDLKFTRSGIKRWAVQNCYKRIDAADVVWK